jgi:hypothetical protein
MGINASVRDPTCAKARITTVPAISVARVAPPHAILSDFITALASVVPVSSVRDIFGCLLQYTLSRRSHTSLIVGEQGSACRRRSTGT